MNNKSINRNRNRKEIVKHITQVAQSLPLITNGHLLICDWLIGYSKSSKKVKFRQATKMLLSLRSNPQTMSPYIQESDGLCTSTDHHLITTYCSTYGSVFVLE